MRGRPPTLNSDEETFIAKAVIEFAERGLPLPHTHLIEFFRFFTARLPSHRQQAIRISTGPSRSWVTRFCQRHGIRAHERQSLEAARAESMRPEYLAEHFARLQVLYKMYNIRSAK